jgi:hypothetical protein
LWALRDLQHFKEHTKSVGICGLSLTHTHITEGTFVARKSTTRSNQRAFCYYEGFRLVFSAFVGTRCLGANSSVGILWASVGLRAHRFGDLERYQWAFRNLRHPVEQATGASLPMGVVAARATRSVSPSYFFSAILIHRTSHRSNTPY